MIPRETLVAYLEDALGDEENSAVENALRDNDTLRRQLRAMIQERDRGEHTVGAVWRRRRLSCPTREQLGSFLLGALDPEVHDYVAFHLRTIGCAFCLANLADLQAQQEQTSQAVERRKRVFDSSAGLFKRKR
jgi:hypothetical protein